MSIRKDYWQKVLTTAQQELGEMRTEREEMEVRLHDLNGQIVQLEHLLASLQPMASEVPHEDTIQVEGISELELADAIREVLKMSEQHRTPRGVRDSLKSSGYDLTQHTNALASVHGVLKRLAESGEAEQLETRGKTYYRWRTSRPDHVDIMAALKRSLEKTRQQIEKSGLESQVKKRG
jgi:hypothetical protein